MVPSHDAVLVDLIFDFFSDQFKETRDIINGNQETLHKKRICYLIDQRRT